MKKFVALYLAPASAIEQMTERMKNAPEQAKAGMDAWMKWAKQHEKSILELGAPLGKTKKITATGASDTKNDITGYSVVQADSHESAAKIFEGHPHFHMSGGTIEVLECMPIPGM
ncbi:MAG TPA: YciI family protein [Xanthobacteraceae bacterium]